MELNINSPAYFTNHYGVDDEVYRYCQNLHNYFKTKEYSETLTIIGITPIVAPKEVYNQGLWKAVCKVGRKYDSQDRIERCNQYCSKVGQDRRTNGKDFY